MKKILSILLMLCISLCLMTACGSNEENKIEGKQIVKTNEERPCRIAMSGNPYADPHLFQNWAIAYSVPNFYDSLVVNNLDGEIISHICESWEAENDTTYVFELKPNVKFHDGSEMKASDIVFSWLRQVTIDAGFSYLFKDVVKDVNALDDYRVQFILNHPSGPFIETLCRLYIVNENLVMNNLNFNSDYNYGEIYGDFGRTYLSEKDAGSGPYLVRELSQGNYIIGDQFKDYIIPFPDNAPTWIQFINNVEATTVRTMIANGELECTDPWQSAENIEAISKFDGVDIVMYSNLACQNITLNNSRFPTNDVNFRKAIAYCIDYETIVNTLFPGSKLAIGPLVEGYPSYKNVVSENPYHYNPEKAKEYLTKSSYNGEEFEFCAASGNVTQEKISMAVQNYCKAIGINCTINSVPYSTQIDLYSSPKTAPSTTIGIAPYYFEPGSAFESLFASASAGTSANPTWISDKSFDEEITRALQITNREQRFEAYRSLEHEILEKCYSIFLTQTALRVCYRSDYVDWPSAKYYEDTGKLSTTLVGAQFWLHDWGINK